MLSVFSQLVIFILTAGVSLTLAQQMLGVQQLGASCSNCGAMQVQISNLLTETCTIQTFWRLRKDPDIASSNKETLQASLLKSCRAIIFGPLFTSRNFTTEELLAVSFSNNYDYRKAFAQLSSYLCFRVCAFSVASVRRCYEFQTETSAEHAEADDPSYTFLLKIVQTNAADQAFDFQVLPEVSDSSSNASQPFAIQEDQFCKTGIPAQT